ncbi:hypothetical protein AURDEDRAFT_116238 [Auricularia subglabra TFB-10046 SS5]|nr:hypothetical protein AURDEDRAFT_116238 [Auricularia subglabra TFB-10046 SS5]
MTAAALGDSAEQASAEEAWPEFVTCERRGGADGAGGSVGGTGPVGGCADVACGAFDVADRLAGLTRGGGGAGIAGGIDKATGADCCVASAHLVGAGAILRPRVAGCAAGVDFVGGTVCRDGAGGANAVNGVAGGPSAERGDAEAGVNTTPSINVPSGGGASG